MLMYGSTAFYIGVTGEKISGTKMWSNDYTINHQYCCTGGMATTGSLTRWIRDEMAKELCCRKKQVEKMLMQPCLKKQREYLLEVMA